MRFPSISIYIQPFLVALLFGIGTDYCILLLNRYKEELAAHDDKTKAVYETFVSGGKTILICGSTIFVSFLVILFAQFDLFRSAVGIGVGVVCLLIIMYTLLPLIMVLLGEKYFGQVKATSHKENRFWGKLGNLSSKHAFVVILVILAVFFTTYLLHTK